MRILVLSDTHGDFNRMMKAVTEQPTAEVIIHCGDGEEQVEYLKQNFKDKMVVGVRGNCDWGSMLPATETLRINGKTIFITHGHLYNAKVGLYTIMCAAREAKAIFSASVILTLRFLCTRTDFMFLTRAAAADIWQATE